MNQIFNKKSAVAKFMLLALIVIFANACEENPESFSLDRDAFIVTDTLFASYDTTFAFERENFTTLGSTKMLLGALKDYKMYPIIRFSGFQDSIVIDSVVVRVYSDTSYGNIGAATFNTSIVPINANWVADTSAIWVDNAYEDNLDNSASYATEAIGTESEFYDFIFNASGLTAVSAWAEDDHDDESDDTDFFDVNFGFTLKPENPTFINELNSRNTLVFNDTSGVEIDTRPKMFVWFKEIGSDSTQIDTLSPITDAYLSEGDFNSGVPDRIFTSTQRNGQVSVLQFDLDSLTNVYNTQYPNGVVVSSADLEMFIDNDKSIFKNAPLRFLPLVSPLDSSGIRIDDRFTTSAEVSISFQTLSDDRAMLSVGDAFGIASEKQEFGGNYLQISFNEGNPFTGFYFEDTSPPETLREIAFYRYNATDVSKRPRMIIKHIVLPDERF